MGTYLVVEESVLPDVFAKVVYCEEMLNKGIAHNATEAAKMAGISRSVYYKYRSSVYPYTSKSDSSIITVQLVLLDRPGVLVQLLTVFYEAKANILTVNQNIPLKGKAFVSITAKGEKRKIDSEEIIRGIKSVEGVLKIDTIID